MTVNDYLKKMVSDGIDNGDIPAYLYKYMPINQNSLRGLANHSLWFSFLSSFNDPFEGQVVMDEDAINRALKAYDFYSEKNNQLMRKSLEHITKSLKKSSTVCCFSNTADDILLWSHYSDCHRGMCLKFDLKKDLDFFSPLMKVKYDSELEPAQDSNSILNHCFLRKYDAWQYEKEFRIVKKQKAGAYEYKSDALSEVIFGCRTSKDDQRIVFSILKDKTNFKICRLHREQFKLKLVKLSQTKIL